MIELDLSRLEFKILSCNSSSGVLNTRDIKYVDYDVKFDIYN